jgi:hypothetical protein
VRTPSSTHPAESSGGHVDAETCPEFHILDEYSKRIWLSHARSVLPLVVRLFAPRFVVLGFGDAFRATLITVDDHKITMDHGKVNIVGEATEKQ